jgi:hypothetical protein
MRMTRLAVFTVLYPAVRLFGLGLAVARTLRSGHRSGARHSSPFVPQIEALIRQTIPTAICFPCLGTKLALPENEIRVAARVLAHRPDFRVHVDACHICQRWERVIRKVASSA